ncbi:alpha/beta fold hydrolase [Streptomyces sp. NPDC051018]|uniref:alpha/beta fold hydrolase n=1 Tax=Streptomyces sp. NPDC051018 TaxID=3365639 RepID=UPI00378CA009
MLRYGTVRTRRDTTLIYTAIGSGSGEGGPSPVLLLHPINLRKECWLGVVPALARDRLCVSVDLAGHGESGDDGKFSLGGWAEDCADLVASLGLGRFHAVGGSLGGTIALALAGELPSQVLSVTAMGSSLGDERDRADGDGRDEAQALDSVTVEELFAELAAEAVAPGSPDSLVTTVRHLTNTHGEQVVRRVLRAARDADATPWVSRVRSPALVLTGDYDTTCTPQAGTRLAESVDGRHRVLYGVGHLPMLEAPATLLRILLPHLETAERR